MPALPPDFRSRDFLLKHVQHTMDFYHPRAIDPLGGFYHYYKDDGTVYDTVTRHLVSSTRFVLTIRWPINTFTGMSTFRG
jgi:mannose/cellobiose epimerase-like protein (N-acyl-D-glucosamine 2-epimerase family)